MKNEADNILAKRDLIHQFNTEEELIHQIVGSSNDTFNGLLFENLIRKPFPFEDFRKTTKFKVAINVLRSNFGFNNNKKPGDFDILILPMTSQNQLYERLCAVEVKVARPTRFKPNKSSNSMGSHQVKGLIEDGFPIVGLIQICMTEPLQEKEKQNLTHIITLDNDETNYNSLEEMPKVDLPFDHFSWASSENQMKRMKALNLPSFIGLNSLGINATKDGGYLTSYHINHNKDEIASYNPFRKKEVTNLAKTFFNNPKNYFIQKKH